MTASMRAGDPALDAARLLLQPGAGVRRGVPASARDRWRSPHSGSSHRACCCASGGTRWCGCSSITAIITPGDVVTAQLIMGVPMTATLLPERRALVAGGETAALETARGGRTCLRPARPRAGRRPPHRRARAAPRRRAASAAPPEMRRGRHRQQRHRGGHLPRPRPGRLLAADQPPHDRRRDRSRARSADAHRQPRTPRSSRRGGAVLGGAVADAALGGGARARHRPAADRGRSSRRRGRWRSAITTAPRWAPTASPTRSRCARSTGRRRSSSTSAPRPRSTASRSSGAYLGGVIAPGIGTVGRGAVPARRAAAAGRAAAPDASAGAHHRGIAPRRRAVGRRRAGRRAGAPPGARDEGNAAS